MENNWGKAGLGHIDHQQVRLLSHLQRANLVSQADGLRCLNGRHPQNLSRREHRGVPNLALIQDSGKFHLIEHIVAVVPGGLIRAKRQSAADLQELRRRGNDPIDNGNAAAAQHHSRPPGSQQLGLLPGRLRQMHGHEPVIQVANFIQEGDGTFSVPLQHLVDFSVSLGDMHMDPGIQAEGCLLYLQQQLLAAHIRPLRAQHAGDPTVFPSVPFPDQVHISEELPVALGRIKFIELTHCGLVFLGQLADELRNSGPGPHSDMILYDLSHRRVKVTEGGGACL